MPAASRSRSLLEPLAGLAQRACLSVADRDHERLADEEVDLAGLDDLLRVDVAGRLEDDEQRVLVDLELRALMRVAARPRPQARGG